MEQGWDPEVKRYFRKILSTIGWGMLWIMGMITAGFYFGLATRANKIPALIFYAFFIITLVFLVRYYYRTWRK